MIIFLPRLPKDFQSTLDLGKWGEKFAVQVLRRAGYVILHRNWRSRTGELDIVCHKDDTLVFVEVKTRQRGFKGYPLQEIISNDKKKRLYQLSHEYVSITGFYRKKKRYAATRFDLFVVAVDDAPFPYYHHYRGAFSFFC